MICRHSTVIVDSFNEQGALVRCLICNFDLEFDGEILESYLPFQFNSPRGKDYDVIVFILHSKIGDINV